MSDEYGRTAAERAAWWSRPESGESGGQPAAEPSRERPADQVEEPAYATAAASAEEAPTQALPRPEAGGYGDAWDEPARDPWQAPQQGSPHQPEPHQPSAQQSPYQQSPYQQSPYQAGFQPEQYAPGQDPRGAYPADPFRGQYPGQPLATDQLGRPARSRRRLGVGAAAAMVLVAGLLGGGAGGVAGYTLAENDEQTATIDGASLGATAKGPVERPAGSVAAVASDLLPRVVSISVRAAGSSGTGSGFVVRPDGFIVTNNHVIRAAANGGGEVRVTFQDDRESVARIVGRDPSYDLAVLKVDAKNLPAVEFADSDAVAVGDAVIAFGSPLGLSGTVTTGIVSAKKRPVTAGDDVSEEFSSISAIQTDAAINPGNSGGPLVDGQGRLVGVNSAIAQVPGARTGSIGVGFAIPSNQVKRTTEQLISTGKATHPVIGVKIDRTYSGAGARLSEVTEGGPADKAGLRPGDVITAVGRQKVVDGNQLVVEIRANEPEQTVELTYVRGGGQPVKSTVTLAASED